MRVRTLDGTEAAGTTLLLSVLEHAESTPPGPYTADLGRAAVIDGNGAVWFVGSDDVGRLVPLPCSCGHAEYTTYKGGAEVSRSVASTR